MEKYSNEELQKLWIWAYQNFGMMEPELLMTKDPKWKRGLKRYFKYEWPYLAMLLWLSFWLIQFGWGLFHWEYWLISVPIWIFSMLYVHTRESRIFADLQEAVRKLPEEAAINVPTFGEQDGKKVG